MSTALPAAPRRASDAFGSTQFQAVNLRLHGDGHVDRETSLGSERSVPDGPPIPESDIDDTIAAVVAMLQEGGWRDAEYAVGSIRGKKWRQRSTPNGPCLSESDASYVASVIRLHLQFHRNAGTAVQSLRGWRLRGWFGGQS